MRRLVTGQLISEAALVRFGNSFSFFVKVEILIPKSSVSLEIAAGPTFHRSAEAAGCESIMMISIRG